jgi:hypothetical protein
MSPWKDEDIATPAMIKEYLQEFQSGTATNPQFTLSESEKLKVQESLIAMEKFCLEMVARKKNKLYMHDLILMAVGFYGGYLSALDCRAQTDSPNSLN